MKFVYLTKSTAGNCRYCELRELENGTFQYESGEYGAPKPDVSGLFPMDRWDPILRNLMQKEGYEDMTDLHCRTADVMERYQPIQSARVRKLVEELIDAARVDLQEIYQLPDSGVTETMLDEAESYMEAMKNTKSLNNFNGMLRVFYTVIPKHGGRGNRMNVRTLEEGKEVLLREEENLKLLKAVRRIDKRLGSEPVKQTILSAYNLNITAAGREESAQVRQLYGGKCTTVWKIRNYLQETRMEKYMQEKGITSKQMLFHGTALRNIWPVLTEGLQIPGIHSHGHSMGRGLYFSDSPIQSDQFADRYMLIFDVAAGITVNTSDGMMKDFSVLNSENYEDFLSGAHSVSRGNEYAIFDERACTPRYLIQRTESEG